MLQVGIMWLRIYVHPQLSDRLCARDQLRSAN